MKNGGMFDIHNVNTKKYKDFKNRLLKKKKYSLVNIKWSTLLHYLLVFISAIELSNYLIMTGIFTKSEINGLFVNFGGIFLLMNMLSIIVLSLYISKRLSKRFVRYFSFSYFSYVAISCFLNLTRNLGNEDFKLSDLLENYNNLENMSKVVIPILLFSIVFKVIQDRDLFKKKFPPFLEDNRVNYFSLSMLIGVIISSNSNLLMAVCDEIGYTSGVTEISVQLLTELFIVSVFLLVIFSAITYLSIAALEKLKENEPSISLAFTSSLLFALIFNYYLQLGVKTDSELLSRYIFPAATSYQLLVLTSIFFLIYTIFNRYIIATLTIVLLGILVSVTNYIKDTQRNEPLLITDFVWLGKFDLLLQFINIKTILLFILALIIPTIVYFIFRKRVLIGNIFPSKRLQLLTLTILFSLFSFTFLIFKNEKNGKVIDNIPIISTINNWEDIEWMGFRANATYKSLMFVWTKQLTRTIMEKPKGYNKTTMEQIVKKYSKEADIINDSRTEDISSQTVIYILSESLSDPSRIPDVSLSSSTLSNITQIKESTTSGLMQADTYGGGTANMEFQALTGLPYYNLSPSVSVLYSEVVPKMSIFPSISDIFESENRFVLHPSDANNYNRYTIYKKLDFNHLIFLKGSKESFDSPVNVGVYTGDESVYNNVLERVDKNQSQFFSVITMQNHTPWSILNSVDVTASGQGFNEEENENLNEYSQLLTITDQETREFLDSLSNIDKKINVVFYGDHLPGFYPKSAFEDNHELQFQTDYFIWSNWKTEKLDYPLVNSSDFTAELFKHTNSRVSPYYALLTKVLDEASVSSKLNTKEQKEIQKDLQLVEYDITIGNGYLKNYKDFFKIE